MEFVKFVTVILMNKQVCVLMVTSGTIAATSDGATRDGHHENMMDVSSKWIWSLHAEQLTLRRLMSYIYGAPILDVSRSHTTTQHSR
jgi:hypothetical protein